MEVSCPEKYPFLNADLNCNEDPYKQTTILKDSTDSLVKKYLLRSEVDRISLFYRNLDNRQWFGINENDNFSPGSLLKLPLAMAYYKLSEIDPEIFDQEFQYNPQRTTENLYDFQQIKPLEKLESGKVYSIRELIRHMLQYSDNEAVPLLSGAIDKKFFDKVFVDLGVYFPKTGGIEQDFVSVKTYGAILRTLYLASYLNQEASNELLEVMSHSDFKSGIAAGVPSTIKVANKFGERIVTDASSGETAYSELHDCGLIYAPEPYILCVMTTGKDYEKLSNVIENISKSIYENR